ncbi:MAG: helix-turn-helix domain-containing protein, partial [Parasphingorhabdus sp.]
HIVVPITGNAVVESKGDTQSVTLETGAALLLAADGGNVAVCAAGSTVLFLRLSRAAIQAVASESFGNPRRLAVTDQVFGSSLLVAVASTFLTADADVSRADEAGLEKQILTSLVNALDTAGDSAALFPVARSTERAVEYMTTDPTREWSAQELAPVAGVTAATLRRNFKTCLGLTITQLSRQLRLDWVYSRLECVTESRSISELSLAAGFGASGTLNRGYQCRFGETPSQTRARAFRSPRD